MDLTATTMLIIAVQLMAPLAWAVYGEIVSERSGVLNVGLEGAVLLGAWGAAVGYTQTGEVLVGIVAGVGTGALLGLVLAFLYVVRGVDQIVGGIVVNLFAAGFTTAMWVSLQGSEPVQNAPRLAVPLLSDLPVVGEAFFHQNILVLLALVVGPALLAAIMRTRWGARTRVAGEAPEALDAAGLSVRRLRVIGIVNGTTLGALGGSTLLLTSASGLFVANMSNGVGFIALAVVILSRWNPVWGLAAAIGFGLLQALQFQAQAVPWLADVPIQLLLAIPYVISIAVVAFSRSARYPAATGAFWPGR